MSIKAVALSAFIIASALAVTGWVRLRQRHQRTAAALEAPLASTIAQSSASKGSASEPPSVFGNLAERPTPTRPSSAASALQLAKPAGGTPSGNSGQRPAKALAAPAKMPKPPLQDPTARLALSYVGADPEAGAYWLDAIFDPGLPDQEREDLMEDLNEEGLSDDKQPGPEDFPLIMNRIALIEGIAPDADAFMLPHLWEAYKDLLNLAEITQGRGNAVQ